MSPYIVKELIKAGIDVKHEGYFFRGYAILYAARNRSLKYEVVDLIVAAGSIPNLTANNGDSLLELYKKSHNPKYPDLDMRVVASFVKHDPSLLSNP